MRNVVLIENIAEILKSGSVVLFCCSVLGNLGNTYRANGEYMKAQEILENVLSVMRKHPETDNFFLANSELYCNVCFMFMILDLNPVNSELDCMIHTA